MTETSVELQKNRDEIKRLVKNWQALLDAMPEMVLLLGENSNIEYQNRSAVQCLGDLRHRVNNKDIIQLAEHCQAVLLDDPGEQGGSLSMFEACIEDVYVECSAAPFHGYTGEQLIMVIMRDVSQRKQQEYELSEFNTNIEVILEKKIVELQESQETRKKLSSQVNSLKSQLGFYHEADQMVGKSRILCELREMVHHVAKSDATILITGESGTGKELVANLVKASSNRADKPFLKINCNTINDSLLESDLFGYEKGSFTGATSKKKGKFEVVDGGTIFLDEIGDISSRMQASLLRVLQNGEIVRVGGTKPVKVDVRVIAATNVNLAEAVQQKKFRLDLFYRLNIINIDIPPLRERKEDIVDLVSHFVQHYREAFKKEIDFVPQSIINRLLLHDWPGNVRELENIIQRAVLLAKDKMITEEELCFDQGMGEGNCCANIPDLFSQIGSVSLKSILAKFESEAIRHALYLQKGDVAQTAKELHLGKTALYDKMKKYKISAREIKKGL